LNKKPTEMSKMIDEKDKMPEEQDCNCDAETLVRISTDPLHYQCPDCWRVYLVTVVIAPTYRLKEITKK